MKKFFAKFDFGFIVVLGIAFVAIWPFISRASLPAETDAELHIFRLHELTLLIQGGEFYPRWAPNFYHGYGYPIFNYYAPLSYYVGLIASLWARFDAVAGVKFVFVLGLLLAGIGTYGFVRDLWGRRAGFVATAVYLYAPYVQYIDPHARGVLAESFSFGIFPLALWALSRYQKTKSQSALWCTVLLTAGVILSHNLMGLLFFGILASWASWTFIFEPKETRSWSPFVALFLGLCAASFFWLPVFLERDAVNLNTLLGEGDNFDFRTHFLSIRELLAASIRLDWGATEPDFRFNLGIAQWMLGLIGLVGIAFSWITNRKQQRPNPPRLRASALRKILFFILSFFFLIFLMLPLSEFLWEAIPFFPYFQFPWRFMGATAFMLAVIAGVGIDSLLAQWRYREAITAVTIIIPILFGLILSQPTPWPDFGEVNTLRMSLIEHQGRWLGTTSTADFVPATVDTIPERNGNVVAGIYDGTTLDRVNRATLPDGATVVAEEIRPLHTRYVVNMPKNARLRLFLFDFPGWQAKIDGEIVETELGRPEGFLIIPVPAGEHVIDVQFGSTPVRRAGFWLSWGAVLGTAVFGFLTQRHKGFKGLKERKDKDNAEARRRGEGEELTQRHKDAKRLKERKEQDDLLSFNSLSLRAFVLNLSDYTEVSSWIWGAVFGVVVLFVGVLNPTGILHFDSMNYVAEPAETPLQINFGDQAFLIGLDVDGGTAVSSNSTLPITLYWQAATEMDINYQLFVHVLAPDGSLLAQSDKLNPGDFPTKRWPLDRYVRDEHLITIPENAPAGDYTVAVGLWVQTEGWRLPIFDETGQQIGDSAELFTIVVR